MVVIPKCQCGEPARIRKVIFKNKTEHYGWYCVLCETFTKPGHWLHVPLVKQLVYDNAIDFDSIPTVFSNRQKKNNPSNQLSLGF